MIIIAEVKTHSPFGWQSKESWESLFQLANEIGDIISIHTDPRWHGSFELIKKARSLTHKPILAKGIHESDRDIESAIKNGADYVLVVGRTPSIFVDKCFIEPYSLKELEQLSPNMKALWNSRDLKTGGLKTQTFTEARQTFKGWLCQASNVVTVNDIEPGANAVLVGTSLRSFADSLRK